MGLAMIVVRFQTRKRARYSHDLLGVGEFEIAPVVIIVAFFGGEEGQSAATANLCAALLGVEFCNRSSLIT